MDEEALKGFEERAGAAEQRLAALESSMASSKGEPGAALSLLSLRKLLYYLLSRLAYGGYTRLTQPAGTTSGPGDASPELHAALAQAHEQNKQVRIFVCPGF